LHVGLEFDLFFGKNTDFLIRPLFRGAAFINDPFRNLGPKGAIWDWAFGG